MMVLDADTVFEPCPVCKQNQASIKSVTFAPYMGAVCSAECGRKAQSALLRLMDTDKYIKAQADLMYTRKRIEKMERDAVAGIRLEGS